MVGEREGGGGGGRRGAHVSNRVKVRVCSGYGSRLELDFGLGLKRAGERMGVRVWGLGLGFDLSGRLTRRGAAAPLGRSQATGRCSRRCC